MFADRQVSGILSIVNEELASRMRAVVGRLGRGLRQTRAGTGLSPSQYAVLATVSNQRRLRLSELGSIEGLNPTLLSRIVGRLEESGLVTREQDATDRRIAHVAVTEQGRELHARIRGERNDVLAMALARLTPDELDALDNAMPVLESLAQTVRERSL
jgi:DNA-binding MarR family transcriptional regulator